MWNSRDFVVLAAAAGVTFAVTVGTLWTPTAVAADTGKTAITTVKVPALRLASGVEVTAQADPKNAHVVVLRVKNTSAKEAKAEFKASADVYGPSNPFSRGTSPAKAVWSDDYAVSVPAGKTQTIKVNLPAEAYAVATTPAAKGQSPAPKMNPGRSVLTLSQTDGKETITAISLAKG